MRILMLSGRFGLGHEMAANAIREELEGADGDVEVVQEDLLAHFYPCLSRGIYAAFRVMAEHFCGIYNLVYKLSERMNVEIKPRGYVIYRKLKKLLEECRPDVIVCTHPMCEKAVASYKDKTDCQIPLVTCITDISMHPEWFAPQTDLFLAPVREVKEHLLTLGTCPEDILVTGIPVRQQFLVKSDAPQYHGLPVRELSRAQRKVLVMGGGLGIMPELERLLTVLHETPGVHTTVITGRNQKLCRTWAGRYDDVEVLGYVEQIGRYMREADLVVTKAGGITMFELLHSGTPLFVIHPFLEQEVKNARYAQEKGFAKVVWKRKADFAQELQGLLASPDGLEEMKRCTVRAREEMIDLDMKEAIRLIRRRSMWQTGGVTDEDYGYVVPVPVSCHA